MPIRVGIRPVINPIRDGVQIDSAEYLFLGRVVVLLFCCFGGRSVPVVVVVAVVEVVVV